MYHNCLSVLSPKVALPPSPQNPFMDVDVDEVNRRCEGHLSKRRRLI